MSLVIDWKAPRPTQAEFDAGWAAAELEHLGHLPPQLLAVEDAIKATHLNGGARVAQFRLHSPNSVTWGLSRNRPGEFGFFDRFFRHPALLAEIPEAAGATDDVAGFAMENGFTSLGRLAGCLSSGGAYQRPSATDEQVLSLATDFLRTAVGLRLSDMPAWVNWRAWSPWFQDIAWDGSFVWLERATARITVLLFTDTD